MKTRFVAVMAVFVMLALPGLLYAQETDPEAVVAAANEAVNAGDVEGALAYYADGSVVSILPFDTYTGKEEIRAYFEGAAALNATIEYETIQVGDDTITLRTWYTDDNMRALGVKLDGIDEITLQDGLIVTETWTASDESMAALAAAMATLPETGGEPLPIYAAVTALGGLAVAGGFGLGALRRRSRPV